MRWLLDTQALIWLIDDPALLSGPARACLSESPLDVLVSAASIWEIAIKRSIGRLELPVSSARLLELARESGVPILDVRGEHAARVEELPFHHRDPFDRLLAAQAMVEGLTIVSSDAIFDRYGVARVW